jgi:hypothetical protein
MRRGVRSCLPTIATYWLPRVISDTASTTGRQSIHEHGFLPQDYRNGIADLGIVQLGNESSTTQ